ncbi:hypothetical protein [Peptostreptococcus anaerobius]|uniref:hypothetical protein n=1 Tax=Peptostreptococcus anaerobius TaxID=1261 RepID=UPI002901E878|nr:hypothetical protein [Peptostreptococcus anaerobius]MDU1598599.1 hypothetical protein [Peptostreptococcus anaerobius]MDU1682173.1 hypothetical protein [Peptostreptococcus anaerobius]
MADDKFVNLEELIESIEMGLDIEFDLYGVRYYIGAPQGELLISRDFGEIEDFYMDAEDLVNNHYINDKPIKGIWQDIIIYNM